MRGTAGWLVQRATGMLLIAGLFVHFLTMHFSGPDQVDYAFVMKRLSNPYWKAFDSAFLLTAIYHGFNGFWGLATEYAGSQMLLRLSQAVILLCAAALVITGVYIVTL